MPYRYQWGMTFALMVLAAMIGAIAITSPAELGITPIMKNWLIVINVGISQALGLLPRIQKPPNSDRVGQD